MRNAPLLVGFVPRASCANAHVAELKTESTHPHLLSSGSVLKLNC